jgi:hypothetical protein
MDGWMDGWNGWGDMLKPSCIQSCTMEGVNRLTTNKLKLLKGKGKA